MDSLKLYNYFRSSTSYRVRIALELKNLKYEYIPVHLLNNGGEQNSDAYLTLNPLGGVPTLVHNKNTISQSVAIVEYLDKSFVSGCHFFTTDNYLDAKIRQFCEIINSEIHPLLNLRTTQYLEKNYNISSEQKINWFNHWSLKGFAALEKMLENHSGSHCFGNEITAADLFLVPQVFSAQRFNINLAAFPLITKVNDNALKITSFKLAHPYRQIDTPADLKID